MSEARQSPTTTISMLIDTIDGYMRSRESGSDLNERWFCEQIKPVLSLARNVRAGCLSADLRAQINAFRDKELQDEIAKKQRDIDSLERERKRLTLAA